MRDHALEPCIRSLDLVLMERLRSPRRRVKAQTLLAVWQTPGLLNVPNCVLAAGKRKVRSSPRNGTSGFRKASSRSRHQQPEEKAQGRAPAALIPVTQARRSSSRNRPFVQRNGMPQGTTSNGTKRPSAARTPDVSSHDEGDGQGSLFTAAFFFSLAFGSSSTRG